MRYLTMNTLVAVVAGTLSLGAAAQPGPSHRHDAGPRHHAPAQAQGHGKHKPGPSMQHPGHGPQKGPHHPSAHGGKPGPQPHAQHRGAGPDHRWVKGSRVPPQFRGQNYVVNDWQRHGLQRPGRGQQWVQYGGDYLLVAVATGLIAHMVLVH